MRVAHGQFVIGVLLFMTVVILPLHPVQQGAWQTANASQHSPIPIQILAINDFHGQLSSDNQVNNRPAGRAAVLASYLFAARTGQEKRTVIAHAGGLVGVSPPASGLLQDEPTIQFFNLLANKRCSFAHPLASKCNLD